MAFHPERLTGRRARKYQQSLSWRPKPSNTPETLKKLIRNPDLIRGWGRVKAASGKFHYVVLVRHRFVMASHLVDRKTAAAFADGFDALGGDGNAFRCDTCEAVLSAWARVDSKSAFENLSADLQDAVQHRKPNVDGDVVSLTRSRETWRTTDTISGKMRDIEQTKTLHPTAWKEPDSVARRWCTSRGKNSRSPKSLQFQLTVLAVNVLKPIILDTIPHAFSVVDHSTRHVWRAEHMADDPIVNVNWSKLNQKIRITFGWNLFNWYVRVYRPGRVVCGKWLILIPGKTENNLDPVPCDALDLDDLAAGVRRAKELLSNPEALKSTEGNELIDLSHGVLYLADGVWKFTQTYPTSRNRIREGDQIVPELRANNPFPVLEPLHRSTQ